MRMRAVAVCVVIFLSMTACQIPFLNQSQPNVSDQAPTVPPEQQKPKPEPGPEPEPIPDPATVTLAATGDIMTHSTQINAGRQPDESYDFHDVFSDIKPFFAAADLTFGNLETTFKGSEPYTGYPVFNAPDAFADALKEAGFDILQTTNNHAMDSGAAGAARTYEMLLDKGIQPVGTAATPEAQKPVIVEKNDIKLAFLAYTYGTNGIPVPEDQPYLVNLIDEQLIQQQIEEAESAGAEFIIVGLHFGNEYQREPTDAQRQLVTRIFEMGADVILGGHPHVLQPMEHMEINGEDKFVIYSLGNFVSNQFYETMQNDYANKGIVLYLDIVKDYEKEAVTLRDVRYLPTVVHRYNQNGIGYAILPIEQQDIQSETLNFEYPGLTFQTIQDAWEQTTSHIVKYESFPTFTLERAADPVDQTN